MTAARTPRLDLEGWERAGRRLQAGDHSVFVLDLGDHDDEDPPLLVLHGFPTSSFDWHNVVPTLAERRRVILFDYPGFGLSDKPDAEYRLSIYADAAIAVADALAIERVVLVSHDLGVSVAGELLARANSGRLPFAVAGHVLSNGNLYVDLAEHTASQQLLLSLPDQRLPPELADPGSVISELRALFAGRMPTDTELETLVEPIVRDRGIELLPRTIRYISERRADPPRLPTAIECHGAPLAVVWGGADRIAPLAVVDRLGATRPDASVTILDGVGHFPMVEAPSRFAQAIEHAVAGVTH